MNDCIENPRKLQRNLILKTLRPKKYTEQDFFIADETAITSYRDEIASMEHPFFALKGGDTRDREYRNGNVTVTVKPNSAGLATVFDKDIWIYAVSKLQQAIFENKPISRKICFTPYEFFMTTNRSTSGKRYAELKNALARLAGTRIQTNIIYSEDKQETENFGLIDKWRILEEKKGRLEIGMVEVTLPDWLYQGITTNKVLKISADYFRIRKAIDRRIYEIARKHCGYQETFTLSLELLHLKTGSTSSKEKFKFNIKQLAKTNDLPDYEVIYPPDSDCVTLKNRHFNPALEKAVRETARRKSGAEKPGIRDLKTAPEESPVKLPGKMQDKINSIAEKISRTKKAGD